MELSLPIVAVLKRILSSRAFQMALMVCATVIGAVGFLSGVWLSSIGNLAGIAGLVGGAVTFGIGFYGLHVLRRNSPHWT